MSAQINAKNNWNINEIMQLRHITSLMMIYMDRCLNVLRKIKEMMNASIKYNRYLGVSRLKNLSNSMKII